MKFFRRKSKQSTKLIYTYGDWRQPPPDKAIQSTVSEHSCRGETFGERDNVKCPVCRRVNQLKHGDRILCGCNTVIETYGNSLVYWNQKFK